MGGMWSNGNSFGDAAGASLPPGSGEGHPFTVPAWKLGLRQSDDRGDM